MVDTNCDNSQCLSVSILRLILIMIIHINSAWILSLIVIVIIHSNSAWILRLILILLIHRSSAWIFLLILILIIHSNNAWILSLILIVIIHSNSAWILRKGMAWFPPLRDTLDARTNGEVRNTWKTKVKVHKYRSPNFFVNIEYLIL